jgi:hypothetical protein
MQKILRNKDFCKFLGNSVCLKYGYGKRKGGPKLVTGKEYGVLSLIMDGKKGSQIWLWKQIGALKMVTEENLV